MAPVWSREINGVSGSAVGDLVEFVQRRAGRQILEHHEHRSLETRFAAVDRAVAGVISSAWCLDDASVDHEVVQVEADSLVVGLQRQVVELFEHVGTDPLVPAGSHGGRRASLVGVLLVGTAQNEAGQKLVEDDPVWDARTVATQRVVDVAFGKQSLELLPQRVGDEAGQDGHVVL